MKSRLFDLFERNLNTNIAQNIFGTELDYSEFEENGVLRMEGGAEVWNDMIINGLQLAPGAAAPDIISLWSSGIKAYSFDGNAITESASTLIEIPHGYDEGTDIDLHFHWCPVNANAGNVKWNISLYYANAGDSFTLVGNYSVISSALGQWRHTLVGVNPISIPTLKIGGILSVEISRTPQDISDTYGSDAALLNIGLHYKCDTIGSRSRFSKI